VPGTMPDAMTTLLASIGLGHLEPRLRDEAVDDTTFLDLDEEDLKELGVKMGPRRKLLTALEEAKRPPARPASPGADWACSPPPPPPPVATPVAKAAPGLTLGARARMQKQDAAVAQPVTPSPPPETPPAMNSEDLECPIKRPHAPREPSLVESRRSPPARPPFFQRTRTGAPQPPLRAARRPQRASDGQSPISLSDPRPQ